MKSHTFTLSFCESRFRRCVVTSITEVQLEWKEAFDTFLAHFYCKANRIVVSYISFSDYLPKPTDVSWLLLGSCFEATTNSLNTNISNADTAILGVAFQLLLISCSTIDNSAVSFWNTPRLTIRDSHGCVLLRQSLVV